jgi:hypothetical protein
MRACPPWHSPGSAPNDQKGTSRTQTEVPTTQRPQTDRQTGMIGAGYQSPTGGRDSGQPRALYRPAGRSTPQPDATVAILSAERGGQAPAEDTGSGTVLFSPSPEELRGGEPARPGIWPAPRRAHNRPARVVRPTKRQMSQARRPVTQSFLRLGREVECRRRWQPEAYGPIQIAGQAEPTATRAKVCCINREEESRPMPPCWSAPGDCASASPGSPRRLRLGDDCLM